MYTHSNVIFILTISKFPYILRMYPNIYNQNDCKTHFNYKVRHNSGFSSLQTYSTRRTFCLLSSSRLLLPVLSITAVSSASNDGYVRASKHRRVDGLIQSSFSNEITVVLIVLIREVGF